MIFENIFEAARNLSSGGDEASKCLSPFLATGPVEETTTAPHDPTQISRQEGLNDPKVIRETLPPARCIFKLITGIATTIGHISERQESAVSDPNTAVNAATGIMNVGVDANKTATDNLTSPTVEPSQPPTVEPPPIPKWDRMNRRN